MTLFTMCARLLALVGAAALSTAPSLSLASEPAGPLTAEPTVPRPPTKPCVVSVFTDVEMVTNFDTAPLEVPAGCAPPWSKIVLEGDLTSVTRTNSVANLTISLITSGTSAQWTLFMGAPQIHSGVPTWRVERDLTDYSALFRSTGPLHLQLDGQWDNQSPGVPSDSVHGSVRLLFYPQSTDAPAPRVPDGVFAQDVRQILPRNIVKAYVEVLAQGLDDEAIDPWFRASNDRFWYTCVPTASIAAYPALRNQFAPGDDWGASLTSPPEGCNGGSFREAEAWLDDSTFLGIAPVFPWLPSNAHRRFRNALDAPVPSAQALNFIPYRLDITPFAYKLNDGAPHRLSVRIVGDTDRMLAWSEGKLLVYLDPKRTVVPGAIVFNTLAHARPRVSPAFRVGGDVLDGTVGTTDSRKTDVVGYLETSSGRVYSAVHTESAFNDQQSIHVDGLVFPSYRRYSALLALESRVLQSSVRMRGDTVLESDVSNVQYPLRLAYGMSGFLEDTYDKGDFLEVPLTATFIADQSRQAITDHWRGATHYTTALRDHFAGRHAREFLGPDGPYVESDWSSQRDYVFLDTLGGCYTAARLTTAGALTGSSTGAGCPGGVNNNAWYTRPDGSPENMGWAP